MRSLRRRLRPLRRELAEVQWRRRLLRSGRPCAAYIGWPGHGNLGDDAMLQAARGLLPGLELVPVLEPLREMRMAVMGLSGRRLFRFALLGGGTLINPNFAPIARLLWRQGLPLHALGTGAGSCGFTMEPCVDLSEWARLLAEPARLGVRGPLTLDRLRDLGLRDVQVVGDLALALAAPRPATQASPPRVAVNVALPPREQYGQGAFAILRALEEPLARLAREGWEIVPVALEDGDCRHLDALLAGVPGPHREVQRPRDAATFFALVQPCAFAVSVRLHGAILSACAGVPPLLLGYRDKCLDFMESVDLADWHMELQAATAAEIRDRVLAMRAVDPAWRGRLVERAQEMARRLALHARDVAGA